MKNLSLTTLFSIGLMMSAFEANALDKARPEAGQHREGDWQGCSGTCTTQQDCDTTYGDNYACLAGFCCEDPSWETRNMEKAKK